ncbi:MAG: hypothetical protein HY927_15485 [Elusimicrobia bacterium]|nr:hypothetical protein [Elusimicrobiota bacterium]
MGIDSGGPGYTPLPTSLRERMTRAFRRAAVALGCLALGAALIALLLRAPLRRLRGSPGPAAAGAPGARPAGRLLRQVTLQGPVGPAQDAGLGAAKNLEERSRTDFNTMDTRRTSFGEVEGARRERAAKKAR